MNREGTIRSSRSGTAVLCLRSLLADGGPEHEVFRAGAIAPILRKLRETVLASLEQRSVHA
ncbi:MAG: hypothetical protein M5U22_04950 [Thermoleophilia bacterium]|nr:hypothetical protein [Thermoleophilia bacterium]